jgi:two-component system, cell cycle sensor histidine kinase and response regulator CckA
MAAADQSHESTLLKVAARFRVLFPRVVRSHPNPRGPAAAALSTPPGWHDAGDLAAAQVVHDLRNQLTLIQGFVDNLSYMVPRGYVDTQIAELRRTAERASALARNLLTAVEPHHASRRLVNLNEVLMQTGTMLSSLTDRKVRMELRLAPEPVRVVAERAELERILLNLVLNAREALARDGVITVETQVARDVAADSSGVNARPRARLIVADTGVGVNTAVRARMFEPFFTTKPTGTGLGLSCVAATVQDLRGEVTLQSEPGRGTRVTVTLPLAPESLPGRP